MGADVEGMTLESTHLEILQNEVMRSVLMIESIFYGESIAKIHTQLLGVGIRTI